MSWTPSSWRERKIAQDVQYPSSTASALPSVTASLRSLPPLVVSEEVERLRTQLAEVAKGRAFLLQGGDCAELFAYAQKEHIESKVRLLLLMSLIIIWGARMPVVRIIRGAGQYAKPRSKPTEMVNGQEVLSYRGDNVNGIELKDRTPDPQRLLSAYFHSGVTINYIRSLLSSGFADLHHPRTWSFSHVRSPELHSAFESIVERLEDSLDFMQTIGADRSSSKTTLSSVDLFTSHEGLLLEYEEALTRPVEGSNKEEWFNASAHYLWIGDRTRQIDGAHIEYFRGIRNPIGLKCGPTLDTDELLRLLEILDPDKEPGRLSLICRYGADKIEDCLPKHIEAVKKSGHPVVWVCDPMHGNTKTSDGGLKTRHIPDIVVEISRSIEIHSKMGSRMGGIHLEMTGEVNEEGFSVTECLGGSMQLPDQDLSLRYQTFCDPRLNMEQSLDIAFLISNYYQNERKGRSHKSSILDGLQSRGNSAQR